MTSLRRVLVTVVLGLAIATTGAALEATALAKSHSAHHKKAARHRSKKHSTRSTTTAHGQKGPKGDKGDKGDPGAKGDKGDPATALVARARLAAPTSTGDGRDADVPLTGSSWTATPDEADDFAGTVTVTAPSACDAQTSSPTDDPFAPVFGSEEFPGGFELGVQLDGDNFIGWGFRDYKDGDGGKSFTVPIDSQARALAGDAPTTHTLAVRSYDSCASDGQSFTITDLRINVYSMH